MLDIFLAKTGERYARREGLMRGVNRFKAIRMHEGNEEGILQIDASFTFEGLDQKLLLQLQINAWYVGLPTPL